MPPLAFNVAMPSHCPQVVGVIIGPITIGFGLANVTGSVVLQPPLSVTTTLYVPPHNPVAVATVCASGSVQLYVNGAEPEEIFTVAVPLHTLLQPGLADVIFAASTFHGFTVDAEVCVQPFASVIVAVYDPTHNEEMVAVVCPFGAHEYV